MRQDRPDPDAGGQTVTVDGLPVHFVRLGAGPPVVLIHGASGNLRDWTFDAAGEIARSHSVIAFDRPGHGLSGWPAQGGESLVVQARLMRKAMTRIGVRRAVVVGHSYGGSVAIAWALDAPETVDSLVLISAPSQVWLGGLGFATDLLANPSTGPLLAQSLPYLLPAWVADSAAERVFAPQPAPPGYLAHLRLDLVLAPTALRANAKQLSALKDEVRAMVPRYRGLAMPVEILHGTADTTVPLKIHSFPLAAQLRHARLEVLQGIGHMPHHVSLPAVRAAIGRNAGAAA